MKEKAINQDAVNTGNPTEANDVKTIATLKEEVARLIEENKSLAEKLKDAEFKRDIFKDMWSKADDKLSAMLGVTKELIALAKLD